MIDRLIASKFVNMADVQHSINPIAPPPLHRDNLPMLYYGLVVIATATVLLAVYNLIIIRLCTGNRLAESEAPPPISPSSNSVPDDNLSCPKSNWGSSFKYKKGLETSCVVGKEGKEGKVEEHECSVCLSGFEDGEDVSELPRCRHSFHAQCIGMWLYSHFDCPLCRQRVDNETSYPNVV